MPYTIGRDLTASSGNVCRRLLICALAVGTFIVFHPAQSSAGSVLATLQMQHPRLLFRDSDLPAIKHAVATDPFVKQYYEQQLTIGEKLLTLPPDTYQIIGEEHTLLATSRDMEGRIFTLSGLYRLTGDKRFAVRATQEMLAAASFPDWYTTHFLGSIRFSLLRTAPPSRTP